MKHRSLSLRRYSFMPPHAALLGVAMLAAMTGACSADTEDTNTNDASGGLDGVGGVGTGAASDGSGGLVGTDGGSASGGASTGGVSSGGASSGGSTSSGGTSSGGADAGGSGGETTGGSGGVSTGGTASGGAASGGASSGGASSGGAASGGAGGGPGSEPCPAGSTITAVTATAGYALYGTVFGTSYYVANNGSTANPKKIQVKVTNNGSPVSDCEVAWSTADRNGWVFPDSTTTNASGLLSAYWTAGDVSSQTAHATIALSGGGSSEATITGSAKASAETRTNSIHFTSHPGGNYTEYKVQVTPTTGPSTTYYETQGWTGAYGGIQFTSANETKVIFSVWDTGGQSSLITDDGVCNQTVSFGGEGTGTSCRLVFPPSQFGAIAGLPNDYALKPGDTYETHLVITFPSNCGGACTDYTFYFSDITRGLGPISLGTQRYMAKVNNNYSDIFIEDWSSSAGDSCISAGARTAYFHDMQAKVSGSWKNVTSGTFSPNYVTTNNEICANYYAASVSPGKFLLSSGGDALVGRPLFDDSITLP